MGLFDSDLARAAKKALALNAYLAEKSLSDGILPWLETLSTINSDISSGFRDAILGKRGPQEVVRDLGHRLQAGLRYAGLVERLGGEIFGSARFDGERVLVEGDVLRLSYLPPKSGVEGPGFALFHAGGFIPFSDRIFRFLPEANFFAPFLERGVPVYAVELDASRFSGADSDVTVPWLIDELDRLSDVAFSHQGAAARMVIEGYCGLAAPMLAYLAAKPQAARAKFSTALTMVAPIDGRACAALSELACLIPEAVNAPQQRLAQLMGRLMGDQLRVGIDIALGTSYAKSPAGRFAEGWTKKGFAAIRGAHELDPFQRRELAGAYWISPKNSRRHPLPAEVLALSTRLFTEGLADDLRLPITYGGDALTLRTILDETDLQLIGIYGGRDPVVPPNTAEVLVRNMGERYRRVVHKKAGHISYVLSPELWQPTHPAAFRPDPISAIVAARAP